MPYLSELERLRQSVDLVPSLIAYVTAEEKYALANRTYYDWLGVEPSAVIGRTLRDVVGDEVYTRIKPHVDRVLAGERQSFIIRLPYHSGARDVNVTYVPDPAADGHIQGYVALITDVTDVKQLEEDLRAHATALERERAQAQAAARSAAFLSDASRTLAASLDHRQTFANLAALTAEFFRDCCIIDVIEEGKCQRLAAAHVNPSLKPVLDELRKYNVAPRDGNRLWQAIRTLQTEVVNRVPSSILEAHAVDARHLQLLREVGPTAYMIVPMHYGGHSLGVISITATGSGRTYDVDDRRTAEELAYRAVIALANARLYTEAQEASRLKDEFLAIVSHELRTPLNAMRGWTSVLRSMNLDAEKKARALEVLDRNISAQTQLVEDLLDISRIVSGRMRLTVQPVDVAPVVLSAIDSVRHAAVARAIRLDTVLDADVAPVLGDPARIQQIVWNLLSNAIKFTPKEGVVDVRLRLVDQHAELSVRDTGQGIAPDFLPHVFERFRQGDATTTRPIGGLGLGLAIVRHLVELHGGTVHVESAGPGQGATFTVRLPVMQMHRISVRAVDAPAEPLAEPTLLALPRRLDGIAVLCVDDDAETCEVLSLVLRAAGAHVRTAADATTAFVAVEEAPPDVLISDIEMPGEDGYSLLQKIRGRDLANDRRTVAIALTAYARREDRLRALAAGFQSHVPKPIEPTELVAVIASLLGRVGVDPAI